MTSRLDTAATGLRVLDLSSFLPGPLASRFLADFGADVLKIEPPAGDAMRGLGPQTAPGTPAFHAALNTGKSIRRMDLKQKAEQLAFLELVDAADILLDGFRPGVMARFGLSYADLSRRNPRLIYCALSGYGAEGPLAETAGHDINYLAGAGTLDRNGTDIPAFYDPPLADVSGSLFATIAILAALRARDRDGKGCFIDIALADTAMALQVLPLADLAATGSTGRRGTGLLNGGAAYYQVYATSDGSHVALGAIEPKFWRSFCTAACRPDWVARQADPLPQTALIAEVAAAIRSQTLEQCLDRFSPADCCLTAVLDLADAVGSPHHQARGFIRRTGDGSIQSLFPARVDGAPPALRSPPIGDPG